MNYKLVIVLMGIAFGIGVYIIWKDIDDED